MSKYKACPSESGTAVGAPSLTVISLLFSVNNTLPLSSVYKISRDIHCHLPEKSQSSTAGNNGAPTSVPLSIGHALYRVSQEECARLREGVPYVKVYRYNPKHLCPKLNGYGVNGQRKVWSSCGSTHCTCQLTILSISVLECGVK